MTGDQVRQTSPSGAVMIGEVIAGYRIVRKLGEGRTGPVFLGNQVESGQAAAVKLLDRRLSADAVRWGEFVTATRDLRSVIHAGLAQVYDIGVLPNGRPYLVMEHLQGPKLAEVLRGQGRIADIVSLTDIIRQVSSALAAVHSRGWVHGALEPAACYLTSDPSATTRFKVKVTDFGMRALLVGFDSAPGDAVGGAPLYQAPEAWGRTAALDHRSDIYSLGCILFEMARGRPPFVCQGRDDLARAHATATLPTVESVRPCFPAVLDALMARMVAKDPASRPQATAEVARICEAILDARTSSEAGEVSGRPETVLPPALPATVVLQSSPTTPEFANPRPASSSTAIEPVGHSGFSSHRHDPTAILPPEATGTSAASVPPRATPSLGHPVATRQREDTAMLDELPARVERPARKPRSSPPPQIPPRTPVAPPQAPAVGRRAKTVPPTRQDLPFSIPVVLVTASVLVTIGVAIMSHHRRQPEPSAASGTPQSESAIRSDPTPAPVLPTIPSTSRPASINAQPPGRGNDTTGRANLDGEATAIPSGKARVGRFLPASRW